MIAVSIARGRHRMLIAEHRHLVEQGAELVELRLDYIVRSVDLKRLVNNRPCPVIITCRREQDGGKWTRSEEERKMLLRSAIADGVEYVDLEEEIASEIPRFGKTKRIVSYHNFRETPENLREIHDRCVSHGADIVKIATMAHNPKDNLRVLQLIGESEVPTIAICMGDMGTPSRILAAKFGAPFTYASFHQERALAPGQLSYQQMKDIYHYDAINPDTDIYGLVADPIGSNLAPLVHNAAFRYLRQDNVFVPFRVPREELEEFLSYSRQFGIKGIGVNTPHKEAIVPFLSVTEQAVDHIGAANTVVIDGFDKSGYNTEYRAALDSIDATLGRGGEIDVLVGKAALVLGAGGLAKAITYALTSRGVDVIISSRTFDRAQALAQRFNARVVEWTLRHSQHVEIIVNCTPVGMHPHVDDSPFDGSYLRRSMIVFDTVYNPEQTLFVKQAREQDCYVITGVDMFVRQTSLQFELFADHSAPVDIMRQEIKRVTGAAQQ
ncbi:MAG: type I 3-dehydroquinate dehydratase [Pirellulaceae bacterium]